MCGIVGVVGRNPASPLLVEALRRLEYRGYDSAGIATLVNGHIERRRAEGKLARLAALLDQRPLPGTTGIGHTRWATHGRPSETNAHPIATDRVAVVHNGIIENHAELKARLAAAGATFETETDTETVARLLDRDLAAGATPEEAMAATLKRIEGAFALAVLFAGRHDMIMAARRGSPLAIGYGDGEMYVGSDALALAPLTERISYLEEGDWAIVTQQGAEIFDHADRPVVRPIRRTAVSGAMVGKGNFRHFMQKEIHEQPAVIGDTLKTYLDPATRQITLPDLPVDLARIPRVSIVACGTSLYAGQVARDWFEQVARLPATAEIASEFRYREPVLDPGALVLCISQSGETVDTLAALRWAKGQDQRVLSVVNVRESAMERESDGTLLTLAGPEIGVASTKAFTTQLAALACLVVATARARGTLSAVDAAALAQALIETPGKTAEALELDERIAAVAAEIAEARDVLYLGRGTAWTVAMEGALKLKEISYIHAEGYPAGEMKHGPIALIDEHVPVVVVAPPGRLFEKTASNVQEVHARGGRVVLLSDRAGCEKLAHLCAHTIALPETHPFTAPIVYSIPVQLLAYHAAVLKGTDVDQPRNLAKSVTVE
ncbi:glutamine--fructose-6-phosphate transaminase (isomerizing) [Elioraea sp. Yellowstone]|jgi:glucosamine--fructose-6-phosphate aminotransferase (isomerizing)|uniref:glutamine--fructose-6-phosphate transaminase (isomerizing) n=1 Tax=Elioraea sp. Yellowstone TaxID=2592070 RepID=UPI001153791F|nr:glutamine--fructose-6-phosphate transaminase (isomerizing) [Elioraea sp. Yellowstone]TQF83857.1 glutamine--fructose-6-phosphate transaminase (isomerizing) [Elioraea sp. Yellowstone]